jgi:hypothetical protein
MWRGLAAGFAAGALIVAAVFVLVDRMAADEQAAERRALIARNAALTAAALAPGSALACLEADAGAPKACELAVFATAQSAAAATALIGERLKVLEAAQGLAKSGDREVLTAFKAERAVLERDRFGIVAHVLARRYGCTPDRCDALAWLSDPATVKADLAAKPFDALIADYERLWDRPGETAPVAAVPIEPPPQPVVQAPAASALAKVDPSGPAAPHPLDPKWKLPSAASIPAISIMTPEPKLPKTDAAASPNPSGPKAETPLPPQRPQAQATPAAEAR